MDFSRKNIRNHNIEDTRGMVFYVIAIPGGVLEFEEKSCISKSINLKEWKINRKLNWKSLEVKFKRIDILNRGVQPFVLEIPNDWKSSSKCPFIYLNKKFD